MHCQFVTGIVEIKLDISYFNITACTSTEINKARVNYGQPDIAIKTGTDEWPSCLEKRAGKKLKTG